MTNLTAFATMRTQLEAAANAGKEFLWLYGGDDPLIRTTRFDEKLKRCLDLIPVDEFILTLMCKQKLKDQPVHQIYELDIGAETEALYLPASVVRRFAECMGADFFPYLGFPIFAANPSLCQSNQRDAARFYGGYEKGLEMRHAESFATFCTEQYLPELRLLLKSIALFHPGTPVYVVGDFATRSAIDEGIENAIAVPTKRGTHMASLMINPDKARHDHHPVGIYTLKMLACEFALEHHSNVVYCDADLLFTDSFPAVPNCDVAFALHGHDDNLTAGQFNAGLVYILRRDFVSWWREMYLRGDGFVDQGCFDYAADGFDVHILPPTCNFGHWRLSNAAPGLQFREGMSTHEAMVCAGISTGPDGIRFAGRRLQSVHCHLISDLSKLNPNNALLKRIALFALEQSGRIEHQTLSNFHEA